MARPPSYPLWCFCSRLSFCWHHFLTQPASLSRQKMAAVWMLGVNTQPSTPKCPLPWDLSEPPWYLPAEGSTGKDMTRLQQYFVMLVMDLSTLLPSWRPGHSSAPSGCTGEPQAQSACAGDGAAARPSCLGCPVALHSGSSSPWQGQV